MPQLFTNNARALIVSAVAAGDTSITIESAKADTFPVCNTGTGSVPAATDWCKCTLQDSSGNIEIIYVRTRTLGSAVLQNVLRGQEGTSARAFAASTSVCGLRLTAADLAPLGPLANATTATAVRAAIDCPQTTGTNATGTWSINITGNSSGTHTGTVVGNVIGNVTGNTTGTHFGSLDTAVTAVTQAANDNSTKVATTAYVASNSVPTGGLVPFAGSTAPTGFLECNGAAVSRTTYAALFAVISTLYGTGDGSTTFNLPDLRGEFIRGWDHGRGVDSGRANASFQSDAMQGHLHSLNSVYSGPNSSQGGRADVLQATLNTQTGSPISDGSNGTPRTAAETRPRNVAMMYCIKT